MRCSCKGNRNEIDLAEESAVVKKLDSVWEDVMKRTEFETASQIIEICEPVWRMAAKYWHRTNLRLGHLSERLFRGYVLRTMKDFEDLSPSERFRLIGKGVLTGHALIVSYAGYIHDQAQLGYFICQLATLYESVPGRDNMDEAYHLYTMAIRIFHENKDETGENKALLWRAQLRFDDPILRMNRLNVNVMNGTELRFVTDVD